MPVRRIGTWKDALRRGVDAALVAALPGGLGLARPLAAIDGYLYPHEAVFLYTLARDGPGDGAVVEIGSFRGRSTVCLALGLRQRGAGVVHAVDPHVYGTATELEQNLAHYGVLDRSKIVVAPSVEVAARWTVPVRLLFIDGAHEEESVAADVRAWAPHLKSGGFLLLHDSTPLNSFPGPRKIASRHLRVGQEFEEVGSIGSISWARRRGGEAWSPPEHGKRVMDGLIHWRAARKGAASRKS